MTPHQREQTRALNDQLRKHRARGYIVFSPQIEAAWDMRRKRAVLTLVGAKDPSAVDNPTREHASGALRFLRQEIVWRIEYRSIQWAQDQPQLPFEPWEKLGCDRILRIMFHDEDYG